MYSTYGIITKSGCERIEQVYRIVMAESTLTDKHLWQTSIGSDPRAKVGELYIKAFIIK